MASYDNTSGKNIRNLIISIGIFLPVHPYGTRCKLLSPGCLSQKGEACDPHERTVLEMLSF